MSADTRRVWLRVAARVIDFALIAAGPLVLLALVPRHAGLGGLAYVLLYLVESAVWVFVVSPFAEALCVVQLSATPGMLVLRLRMLDGDTPITLTRALLRSFLLGPLLIAGALAYGIPAVLYAGWLLWDAFRRPDGRTWPDRVSGTTVVPVQP